MDISNFKLSNEKTMEFSGEIADNKTDYDIFELGIKFPINYRGNMFKVDDIIDISVEISYDFNTTCARCLKSMIDHVDTKSYFRIVSFDNSYEKDEETKDIEIIVLKNEPLNVQDLVMSIVVTSIPYKSICKENCRGLCPKCGQDLNEKICNCEPEMTDPRFEALLGLFNENEEV